ncbi:MAG TPA: T9SS type A sorting domain-containing protein [Chitinophagaceae bacterium]|jgi:TonB-dependent SusC/RagA subfamily outer membrane receptor|nr:T9SS type A sorting domain-containing protein [Chitinophagaceae bacterium]
MRIASTLYLLFIASYSFAQPNERAVVAEYKKCGLYASSFAQSHPYQGSVREVLDSSKAENGWSRDCVGHYTYYGSGNINDVSKALETRISRMAPSTKRDSPIVVVINCGVLSKTDRPCGTVLRMQNKDTTVQPARKDTVVQQPVRLVSCRTINGNSNPLVVVNGIPAGQNTLSELDPARIERVVILKGPEAMAIYGKDAFNGVIIITLKLKYKKMIVVDSADNSPVARATAGITMKNGDKTMYYAADDKGAFSSNSPDEFNGLKMEITAVGYEAATRYFNGDISKTDTIRLKRDIKTCGDVVVGLICRGRRRISCGYTIIRKITRDETTPGTTNFHCYPNPAQKGDVLTLSWKNDGLVRALRIISLEGRQMIQQTVSLNKGKSLFQVRTDPRWSAGVYFVQLVYENGRVAASGKIIIQ